jgi:hypothetical protein
VAIGALWFERGETMGICSTEAEHAIIQTGKKGNTFYGYEELHINDELIEQLKNGKDIEVHIQDDEYVLRIIYKKG